MRGDLAVTDKLSCPYVSAGPKRPYSAVRRASFGQTGQGAYRAPHVRCPCPVTTTRPGPDKVRCPVLSGAMINRRVAPAGASTNVDQLASATFDALIIDPQ